MARNFGPTSNRRRIAEDWQVLVSTLLSAAGRLSPLPSDVAPLALCHGWARSTMTSPTPAFGTRRGRLRVAASAVAGCLTTAWAVGQVARDATWATGLCFYIPSLVSAAALVGVAAL